MAGLSGLRFGEACVGARAVSYARVVRRPSGVVLRAAHIGLGVDAANHRQRCLRTPSRQHWAAS
ncbi:MAG: hypothetical protein ABJF07_08550, partial [Nisaea sp.]|uniref:hypothetical protein n=1 Tax=Nisaea sp. TaxID=2024842 RepID=UPI0032644B6B